MPGPGLDLIGDEELTEVAEVIRIGRLTCCGPDDHTFRAKVSRYEEAGMLPATDAPLRRTSRPAIGVMDPKLAPFAPRRRDSAEVDGRRADRIIHVYDEVVA